MCNAERGIGPFEVATSVADVCLCLSNLSDSVILKTSGLKV